jgi:hypothetical protein
VQITGRNTPTPMLNVFEPSTGLSGSAVLPVAYFTQIGFVGALSTR